jgi:hypothetical protein
MCPCCAPAVPWQCLDSVPFSLRPLCPRCCCCWFCYTQTFPCGDAAVRGAGRGCRPPQHRCGHAGVALGGAAVVAREGFRPTYGLPLGASAGAASLNPACKCHAWLCPGSLRCSRFCMAGCARAFHLCVRACVWVGGVPRCAGGRHPGLGSLCGPGAPPPERARCAVASLRLQH